MQREIRVLQASVPMGPMTPMPDVSVKRNEAHLVK